MVGGMKKPERFTSLVTNLLVFVFAGAIASICPDPDLASHPLGEVVCQYAFQSATMAPLGQAACVYAPSGTFLEARLPTSPLLIPFLSPVPCPGDKKPYFLNF